MLYQTPLFIIISSFVHLIALQRKHVYMANCYAVPTPVPNGFKTWEINAIQLVLRCFHLSDRLSSLIATIASTTLSSTSKNPTVKKHEKIRPLNGRSVASFSFKREAPFHCPISSHSHSHSSYAERGRGRGRGVVPRRRRRRRRNNIDSIQDRKMASRPIVPQQARGEAAVRGGKQQQKKNGGADERKALGDIGNLAAARGVEAKPNRPITRSFCAQLLANAQAAAAADNNKKQACAKVGGPPPVAEGIAVAKRAAPKPGQKKVPVKPKPKPEEVIDIEASPEKEVQNNKKKEGDANSKKKSHNLTSVLTARSKAACGITNKPKEQIIDIDAGDVDNELAAVEYIDDIYKFYKLVENESRPCDYIDSQPDINERMRAILVDWLIDVHTKFDLSLETLYLTINIIDRFLAVRTVPRRELQLVGVSAMLMASKYEEIWPPEVNDFVCLADRAYTHEQILVMEKIILENLEWTLTVPTPCVFLVRFIKASVPDQVLENMAHFLSELGMMHYATLMYCPSMVAASAVFAARCTLNKTPFWNDTLKLHTGYSQEQLMDCAKLLVSFHSSVGNGKLKVVYRKYSDPQKGAVAVLPPAKNLLPQPSSASQNS
ncbi:hypothetical protein VNO77_16959 [Canavalia gladiata]|uniref:B-like cyclin n=1 Tax=Canavalia gladiata TaxID=3824 RepID=A0AAN9LLR6_CANGL